MSNISQAKNIQTSPRMAQKLTWVIWLQLQCCDGNISKNLFKRIQNSKVVNICFYIHRYYKWIIIPVSFGLPVLLSVYFFNESLKAAIYLNIFRYVVSLHCTWCTNSFSHHLGGTKPFEKWVFVNICDVKFWHFLLNLKLFFLFCFPDKPE